MTYGELKRLLSKNGCYFDHEGGNHEIWFSPITNKLFAVGRHNTKEVPSGTLKSIKNISGMK